MELSSLGWQVAFTASALLLVSAIFSNIELLTIPIFLLAFLLIDGSLFHRSVRIAKECLRVESDPQTVKCIIGRETGARKVLSNESNLNFRVIGVSLEVPSHINVEDASSEDFVLRGREAHTIKVQFECAAPGRFETRALSVNLASRTRLFRHEILAPDKMTVIVHAPVASSRVVIDSSLIDDLTPDPFRRGGGSDLAGVRTSTRIEDLHRIDWKATARTGNLTVKEFYLERQPPVVLLVDIGRTATEPRGGRPRISGLLSTLPNLLASFPIITPVGLVLYDEHRIVAGIAPHAGAYSRELILQTILENVSGERVSVPMRQGDMSGESVATSTAEYQTMLGPVLERISWFYKDVLLRRRIGMQKRGAFKAFVWVQNFPEPLLVIGLTYDKASAGGLVEGAAMATSFGHRTILVVLSDQQKVPIAYTYSQHVGVNFLECLPVDLPEVLQSAISRVNRERAIPSNFV
jgi:uncharacterized protein (DUF58 family)